MALNKQQQDQAWWVGVGAGALLSLFLFYQLYWSPKQDVLKQIEKQSNQLKITNDLIKNANAVGPSWAELQQLGLQSDPAQVGKLITDRITSLANGSQLHIDSMNFEAKTTPITHMPDFSECKCPVRATGTTTSVGRFLRAIELARLPMRIDQLTINSRKEGTDDLTVSMNISALVYTPKAATTKPATVAAGRSGRSGGTATRPAGAAGAAGAKTPVKASTTQPSIDAAAARLKAQRELENGPATAPANQAAPKGGN